MAGFYRSCRLGLPMRLLLQDCPRKFCHLAGRSNRSYMSSIFIRNLFGLSVVNRVDPPLASTVCATSRQSPSKKSDYLWKIRKLCENKKLSSAKELLESFLDKYWCNENLTRTFNCFLFHAVQEKNNDIVDNVIEKMEKWKVERNAATYYILTLYYTDRGLLDQGIMLLREMQAVGLKTTSRNYTPLVISAVGNGELEMAFTLYKEMKKETLSSLFCYPALISGVIKSSDRGFWDYKVLEMLQDIRVERIPLNIETLETVAKWFKGQTSNQWQTSWTTINSSGICQSCGNTLDTGALTEDEHATLKQHLIRHLWKSIEGRYVKSFTTTGSFVDKYSPDIEDCLPHSLNEHISKTGPYDVVLDALNIGYYCGKGTFNIIKLQEMVKNLIDDGKKVLVIGAPPLTFLTLTQALNITGSVGDNNSQCGVFLIMGSCIPDDIYMLLAAVHCGINTLLVSNDMFQDHSHKLPISIQILLKRWLRTNQVFFTRSNDDREVLFKTHPSYDPIVQSMGNTWHLPSESDVMWLCAQKTNSLI